MTITKNVELTEEGYVMTVTVEGKLDAPSAESLLDELSERLNIFIRVMKLDFGEVRYISSVGIRCVLVLERNMHSQGGKLVITKASEEVTEVLEMLGLLSLIDEM